MLSLHKLMTSSYTFLFHIQTLPFHFTSSFNSLGFNPSPQYSCRKPPITIILFYPRIDKQNVLDHPHSHPDFFVSLSI